MSSAKPIATTRSVTGIPTGRLAVWWIVASEIVIFGGLLMAYLMLRLKYGEIWGRDAGMTEMKWGALNTFILLTSSYFVVLAHQAASKDQRQRAFKFLWLTIICGFLFMCVKYIEYTSKFSHGIYIDSSVFFSFYFTATGLHGFHVLCGMLIMGIISFDVLKGHELPRVEYIGIYWHFVDLVWIFLFPLLYIAK